jgi:hypothetical protein
MGMSLEARRMRSMVFGPRRVRGCWEANRATRVLIYSFAKVGEIRKAGRRMSSCASPNGCDRVVRVINRLMFGGRGERWEVSGRRGEVKGQLQVNLERWKTGQDET